MREAFPTWDWGAKGLSNVDAILSISDRRRWTRIANGTKFSVMRQIWPGDAFRSLAASPCQ